MLSQVHPKFQHLKQMQIVWAGVSCISVLRHAGRSLCHCLPQAVLVRLVDHQRGIYISLSCYVHLDAQLWHLRDQLQGFLEFPSRDLRVLKGLSATEVYLRQARNLLNIYR